MNTKTYFNGTEVREIAHRDSDPNAAVMVVEVANPDRMHRVLATELVSA